MNNHCAVCGKKIPLLSNNAVYSSTFNKEVCFDCLDAKSENPGKKDFLLVIPDVTDLERDVILNGIAKNAYFNDFTNGAVWAYSTIVTCEKTTPEELSNVMTSLISKGLIIWFGSVKNATVRLTAEGYFFYLNNKS